MTTESMAFSHLGICVSDLDRSIRFYCDGLGFEVAEGFDLDDTTMPGLAEALEVPSPVSMRSQMLVRGAMKVELMGYETPTVNGAPSATRRQLGFTHLSFHVDDVDATVAALVAAGGTLLESTDVSMGIRLVFVTDPDGARVELMSRA